MDNQMATVAPLEPQKSVVSVPIDEGSCLLYLSGLPVLDDAAKHPLLFKYSFNNTNTEQEPTGTEETGVGKKQRDISARQSYQENHILRPRPDIPASDIQIMYV